LIYVAQLLLLSAVCCRVNLNFCQIGQDKHGSLKKKKKENTEKFVAKSQKAHGSPTESSSFAPTRTCPVNSSWFAHIVNVAIG
jgi:hypothetical protein